MNLSKIVKTYDIRGLVGSELTTEVVAAVAAGFVDELQLAGKDVVVGHDMRPSSPQLVEAFAEQRKVNREKAAATLEELINCTVWHFSHEERLMLKHGFLQSLWMRTAAIEINVQAIRLISNQHQLST